MWVQSLSVHSEHLRQVLLCGQKRSGCFIMQISHTAKLVTERIKSDVAKNPPTKIIGENIMK